MPEEESNRTLTDFEPVSDEDGVDEDEATADGDVGDADAGGESADESEPVVRDAASPAVSTSRFAPDGESCASCGASTRRLWLADGDAVCVDCKPW